MGSWGLRDKFHFVGGARASAGGQSPEASEGLCAGRNSSGPGRTRQEPGRKGWDLPTGFFHKLTSPHAGSTAEVFIVLHEGI